MPSNKNLPLIAVPQKVAEQNFIFWMKFVHNACLNGYDAYIVCGESFSEEHEKMLREFEGSCQIFHTHKQDRAEQELVLASFGDTVDIWIEPNARGEQ
jgi:hypothetical protein